MDGGWWSGLVGSHQLMLATMSNERGRRRRRRLAVLRSTISNGRRQNA